MTIYPRYRREENRACKLTEEQIETIKELYVPKKFWMRKVAIELWLPPSTVRYHLISEEERKEFNKMKSAYNKRPTSDEVKKRNLERKIRKWEAFKKYESELKKEYLEKPWVRQKRKKYMKVYREKTLKSKK